MTPEETKAWLRGGLVIAGQKPPPGWTPRAQPPAEQQPATGLQPAPDDPVVGRAATPEKAMMQSRIRVGIADDDQMIRAALSRTVGGSAYLDLVATVEDGKAAVQLAQGGSIDVLILDVEMPEMTGRDALRHIRTLAPSVRVIMHSSLPAGSHAPAFLAAGAKAYLEKPCEASCMVQAIRATAGSE